jgi:hypothetical protein
MAFLVSCDTVFIACNLMVNLAANCCQLVCVWLVLVLFQHVLLPLRVWQGGVWASGIHRHSMMCADLCSFGKLGVHYCLLCTCNMVSFSWPTDGCCSALDKDGCRREALLQALQP